MIQVDVISSEQDNYIYVVNSGDQAIVVDPGSYNFLKSYLTDKKVKHVDVLVTHSHRDHVGGLKGLLEDYPNTKVYAQEVEFKELDEKFSIKLNDEQKVALTADKEFYLQGLAFFALNTPGHCKHHLTFIHKNIVFCGDLLFSVGCGRVQQDGNILDLFVSIDKVKSFAFNNREKFNDEVLLFPGHEYTLDNIAFARSLNDEGINVNLNDYERQVKERFEARLGNTPVNLFEECLINPFLRAVDSEEFARIRTLKDAFKPFVKLVNGE